MSRLFTHHFAYEQGRRRVELHWLPLREPGASIDMSGWWRTAVETEVGGVVYAVPAVESCLLVRVASCV
ncbi:MAG: hypothetical protein R3190_12550 [Thermoanaerobaculia bacterium]|nr:hypothetical protein [Thermoanaerobaculia bacterium]